MSREWVDDAKTFPVDKRWVMRCDVRWEGKRCTTESEPVLHQNQLSLDEYQRAGWFIAKVHGDICPSCLAAGRRPRTAAYGVPTTLNSRTEGAPE